MHTPAPADVADPLSFHSEFKRLMRTAKESSHSERFAGAVFFRQPLWQIDKIFFPQFCPSLSKCSYIRYIQY